MSKKKAHEPLVQLRKELHKFPELSGHEERTSGIITEFIRKLKPDGLISNLGGYGLAASFRGPAPGPRIMVRAELDALPIKEINDFGHMSVNPGVSHKCGHDGHMAVAAGVAREFAGQRPSRGELVVLFQPAEENGKGAFSVINDSRFAAVEPDFIIAMHNLPGFGLNEVVLKEEVFAAASEGMVVHLQGKTSHASEPQNGVSPSQAMSIIMSELSELANSKDLNGFALATVIHARLGEIAFGTSPGEAVIMATLRAFDEEDMEKLKSKADLLVRNTALSENLRVSVKWTESFPATGNDPYLVSLAKESAERLGYKTRMMGNPFKWSEDFGWFTRKFRGMLFGLGAGKGHPELHNPDYDFPDELITSGVSITQDICRKLIKEG